MQPPLALRKVWWKDQRQRRFAYGASLFRALRCDSLDVVAEPQFDIGPSFGSRFQTSTLHVLEMPDAAQLAETPPSAAGTFRSPSRLSRGICSRL
jgi:hypothetical protein